MAHLKRLSVPTSWSVKKKGITFIARPSPGPHKKSQAMTLNYIVKDLLKIAQTTREVKKVLHAGNILVDTIARKDHHFPVGVMDIITIPSQKESYVSLYADDGKFILKKLKSHTEEKLCKIIGKRILAKKKVQLNLYDGKNLLIDKDSYKVGDTILLAKGRIVKHLKMEKGALIYLIGGKHIGKLGQLIEIKHFKGMENDRIIIESGEKKIETLKDYAFIIEKSWE